MKRRSFVSSVIGLSVFKGYPEEVKRIILGGDLVDKDGNIYTTIIVSGAFGNQEWIVENFRSTKYADGSDIGLAESDLDWSNATGGGYCYPGNDVANVPVHGLLYNFPAAINVKDISYLERGGVRELGWHVPIVTEVNDRIVDNLGGNAVAGGHMKEVGLTNWLDPNEADNSSGFTMRGSGFRYDFGLYVCWKDFCELITAEAFDVTQCYTNESVHQTTANSPAVYPKLGGYSLRLVRDL